MVFDALGRLNDMNRAIWRRNGQHLGGFETLGRPSSEVRLTSVVCKNQSTRLTVDSISMMVD